MGYQFDQDDTYECSLDEVTVTIAIGEDASPYVEYRDDANQAERVQFTHRDAHSPPLTQVMATDLKYPNKDGEVSESNKEPEGPFDADYTKDIPMNLGKRH
jgi:hypothetical protein